MRHQPQLHTVGIMIVGALALGMLAGCGSDEQSAPVKQASETTCAEFTRMSESDKLDVVEQAVEGKPGWQVKSTDGDGPSMALRAAVTMAKTNCGQPDAAEKTVADSVHVPRTATAPTP
ncbi:hypothetical protein HLB23_39075 [Nocardia uniformis]|uniref:Uncharacterized protein n=2 Tax=Nocardia uniformis TaxID=53432 RepID=A0A849CFX1_9NOCA|nr:hypothetical protein [Nocardia uniformis]NNH75790.1 hypothetical protein [Nocardia uniformis]